MRVRQCLGVMLTVLAALLPAAVPATAQVPAGDDDTITIIKEGEYPSNAEIAVRLSEETPLAGQGRVVLSRDDDFADALASGVLQSEAPLLLTPGAGPLPARVRGELDRLGAREVVVLGGPGAVSDAVVGELEARGMVVERRAGPTRFETAVEIARQEAPDADTAILARAFSADPDNPSQAFADALSAGGLAAEMGWPVLLSDTASLTPATRDFLAASAVTNVVMVGGTAALSAAVEDEVRGLVGQVERLSGATRFATATAVAEKRGADTAADVAALVLVDGTGAEAWAGGFAAAGHSARFDAPIVLADGVRLPPETAAFVEPGAAFAQAGELTITCVVHPLACQEGRRALGLPSYPLLDLDPPPLSGVSAGQTVTATLFPAAEAAGVTLGLKGTCLPAESTATTDAQGVARFTLASGLSGDFCELRVTVPGPEGDLTLSIEYAVDAAAPRTAGDTVVDSEVLSFGRVPLQQPVYVNDRIDCAQPDADPVGRESSAVEGSHVYADGSAQVFTVTSAPLVVSPAAACTAVAQAPPQARRVLWGLYAWSDVGLRRPLALGEGTTATFSVADLPMAPSDLTVRWLVELTDPAPSAPQPPPPEEPGLVDNRDGATLTCGGQPVRAESVLFEPGTDCEASTPTAGLMLLVLQPDRPNQVGPDASFTVPADSRGTLVRLLPDTSGVSTGRSCATADAIEVGRLAAARITTSAPVQAYVFDAFAGESLRIRMDALYGEAIVDPLVNLIGPDGAVLGTDDDGGAFLNSLLEIDIPADGVYCVEATSYGGSVGEFLLSVDLAPEFTDTDVLSAEVPAIGYDYSAVAGSLAVLEMRQPEGASTDPVLVVLGPDGTELAFDDDGGGYPNARIEFVVPADGVYQVIATVYEDFFGPYELSASFS